MRQRLIIVGGGMAGLNLALALGRLRKYHVALLERDPEPEDVPPEEAFFLWARKGVAHFRQAHILLPRLLNLYRRWQPALLEEVFRAGARELLVREALPAHLAARYVLIPGDENCSLLLSRRATLEAVLRRHVARLSAVNIVPSTRVCGVMLDRSSAIPRMIGVKIQRAGETAEILGDVIVDASGRMTKFPEWLRAGGLEPIQETRDKINRGYYTLFYRLRESCSEPTEFGRPVFANCKRFGCSVYPADNGFFSVTFGFDIRDLSLRHQLASPLGFNLVCESIPEVARWTERADPLTDVSATAGFQNQWRTYVANKQPLVYGFFAIGDALVHTNPQYGAGCSWAAEHARMLAETLECTAEPGERTVLFDQRLRKEAYPFFSFMASSDRASDRGQTSSERPRLVRRLNHRVRTMAHRLIAPAKAGDIAMFRWSLQRRYMAVLPEYWHDRLFVMKRLALFWIGAGVKSIRARMYFGSGRSP